MVPQDLAILNFKNEKISVFLCISFRFCFGKVLLKMFYMYIHWGNTKKLTDKLP